MLVPIKMVVVGDAMVGKTSLMTTYANGEFPRIRMHYYDGDKPVKVIFNQIPVLLQMLEVPTQEDYARIRPLFYPNTDIFLMCFSLTQLATYKHIQNYWYPEINVYCPNSPFILVGTKQDLISDDAVVNLMKEKTNAVPMMTAEGIELAKHINAVKYMECSALTQKGVKEIFEEAISIAINNLNNKPLQLYESDKNCALL